MGVLSTEYGARDNEEVIADGFGDEFRARAPRGFEEQVEGAFATCDLVVIFQETGQEVSFAAVVVAVVFQIEFPCGDAGPLDGVGSADERELLKLQHLLDEAGGSVHEAEPQSGHGVRFAESINDYGLWVPCDWGDEILVVAEGAVDFVADESDVVFVGKFCECLGFSWSGNAAGGVGGTVEDDEFCAWRDGVLYGFDGDAKVGIGGNWDNDTAGEGNKVAVHHKPGIKDNNFFAGVNECEEGKYEGAAGTGCDEGAAIGILVALVDIILEQFEQWSDALRLTVGVAAFLNGAAECVLYGLGSVIVRLTDTQVDWPLHAGGKVEDFADAGSINAVHAFSDP